MFAEKSNARPVQQERRASERQIVDSVVRYRTADTDGLEQGSLIDISESGVMLSIKHSLKLGERIYFMIEPDNPRQKTLHVIASVLRKRSNKHGGNDYGCRIIETSTQDLSSTFSSSLLYFRK